LVDAIYTGSHEQEKTSTASLAAVAG
jgi:hypothetical protein